MPDGCIYIARNDESDPVNHYKVGKTYNASPERRMQQLSSETTNYRGIYLAKGYVLVNDVDECELKIHRHLDEYRINPNREYFNLHVDEISKAIKTELADKICINRLPEPETMDEFPEEFYLLNHLNIESLKNINLIDICEIAYKFRWDTLYMQNGTIAMWEMYKSLIYVIANKQEIIENFHQYRNNRVNLLDNFSEDKILLVLQEIEKIEIKDFLLNTNFGNNFMYSFHFLGGYHETCGVLFIKMLINTLVNSYDYGFQIGNEKKVEVIKRIEKYFLYECAKNFPENFDSIYDNIKLISSPTNSSPITATLMNQLYNLSIRNNNVERNYQNIESPETLIANRKELERLKKIKNFILTKREEIKKKLDEETHNFRLREFGKSYKLYLILSDKLSTWINEVYPVRAARLIKEQEVKEKIEKQRIVQIKNNKFSYEKVSNWIGEKNEKELAINWISEVTSGKLNFPINLTPDNQKLLSNIYGYFKNINDINIITKDETSFFDKILSFKINIGDEASIDANKKEKYKTLLKLIYMLPRPRRSAPHIKKLRQKLIILKNQYLNNYEKKIELLIKIGNESLPVSNLENVLYFDKEIELRFEKNQFHYEFKSNNDIVNLLKGLLLLEKLYSSNKELKTHLRGSCAAHMWLYKKICNSFPELVTSDLIEWINLNKSKVSWLEVE